ncbi:MAG: succinate dehydrogenase [Planctomycetes bacterium]|nr:succinate dehydrogenase [Planctomycetota bacterium]
MDTLPAPSFYARHEFLIRRLHSLSGLIPVGAYMCVHLATNASVLAGSKRFQEAVDAIHSLGPALPLVEWTFIFLPIIFHALVGVLIVRSGTANTASYNYVGNVRYTLQRATAWIALFFIFGHVFHMHGWIHADWASPTIHKLGGGQFDPEVATSTTHAALVPLWAKIVYAIGVLSCVFHFANGLWTMGITWGVWTTRAAQHRANWVCGAFGVMMATVGLSALFGFSTVDQRAMLASEKITLETRLADLNKEKQLTGDNAKLNAHIKELQEALEKNAAEWKNLSGEPAARTQASLGSK